MTDPHIKTRAAVFLTERINKLRVRKTQKQIAHEAGFVNANMLSLLKAGASKIPIDRVPALAKALETDPAYLMRLVLEQSLGKTAAQAIVDVCGAPVTEREKQWLEALREASDDSDPRMTTRSRATLRGIFGK
ncbi:helix-turn-helix domain-containing protein [Celeribacter sp.]|uniref:helix-turn-helix domain-containing protein n=1 Tax=Celeribacter sp. TaxID=1890673 RepID=UPI003A8F0164